MAPNVAKVDADRQLYLGTLPGTSAMRCCVGFFMEQSAPPSKNLLIPFIRTNPEVSHSIAAPSLISM